MLERTFKMTDPENVAVHVYEWLPEEDQNHRPLRGIVQITHGMSETAKRYKRFEKAALATQLSFQKEGGFVLVTSSRRKMAANNPYESLARRATMLHPPGGMRWALEWKLRIGWTPGLSSSELKAKNAM